MAALCLCLPSSLPPAAGYQVSSFQDPLEKLISAQKAQTPQHLYDGVSPDNKKKRWGDVHDVPHLHAFTPLVSHGAPPNRFKAFVEWLLTNAPKCGHNETFKFDTNVKEGTDTRRPRPRPCSQPATPRRDTHLRAQARVWWRCRTWRPTSSS